MSQSDQSTIPAPWRLNEDAAGAVLLRVRLTPKSARDAVECIGETPAGPAVLARVRAVPENGAANAALVRLIAKWLNVPSTNIEVSSGGKSRLKTLRIVATDSEFTKRLDERIAGLG